MTAADRIYGKDYSDSYAELYIDPWPAKHEVNVAILDYLLGRREDARWLDLACGQAWHFSRFEGRAQMTGVDASAAQLDKARIAAPHATFLQRDLRCFAPEPAVFDLVTSFWGAYCYLADWQEIASLLDGAIAGLKPGGSLYIEVLPIDAIMSFDRSRFAARTGFRARRMGATDRWIYRDTGGSHRMVSPPLHAFVAHLDRFFGTVRVHDDGCFMQHLVAYRKH